MQTSRALRRRSKMLRKNIPNTGGLVKKTDYITKITETENKIASITGLVTTTALRTKHLIENKMPDISGLIKKIDYETEVKEVESKNKLLKVTGYVLKFKTNILEKLRNNLDILQIGDLTIADIEE